MPAGAESSRDPEAGGRRPGGAGQGRGTGREGLTSLAGRAVLAVLGPVALDDLPGAVVMLDGKGQAQNMVAGLDDR